MDCYHEIAQHTESWSYYKEYKKLNGAPIDNVWRSNDEAYAFIWYYFGFAEKSGVFKGTIFQKNIESIKERASHTISTFLLGVKMAECFKLDLTTRDSHHMNLLYYWFLACLYHDVGYALENDSSWSALSAVKNGGIKGFKRHFNLQYCMNQDSYKAYPKNVVNLYLSRRASCCEDKPVIDHGIAGGLLLYDKLMQNYYNTRPKRKDLSSTEEDFYIEHSNGRELHFSKSHHAAYAKAADAIIMHNIWKSTLLNYLRDDSQLNKLQKAISAKRIDKTDPLCFLLCLADTLEPIKRTYQKNNELSNPDLKYLNHIEISPLESPEGFKLKMPVDTYDAFSSAINGLEDWINVNVRKSVVLPVFVAIKITA